MSAFLGQIHYWLYGKIRRVIEREELICEKAAAMCRPTAEELREQVWQTYGSPLPDAELAGLIDHDNIHGWLQRQINIAETREAAFIKELLDMCGEAARENVGQAFTEHGILCGRHAREQSSGEIAGADAIYKVLNDYYLNGMPCDQADMVVSSNSDSVAWENESCLQAKNWSRARVGETDMKEFYQRWLAGFVQGANPAYEYKQIADTAKGDRVNRYEVRRRG
ncbi:Hypothetical protein LUCI_2901 [Lucifera butyrica]|uniref:Uncharacterized protein n=1 Tax=Lucifera butyrica TaxID=1351585 RepID=A0A498R4M1_9FIRM|nr:hypothetical protein [Lucifera butyrica]VBB07636.1 Hypothetical protein LUCI_2901 [Lucifera butyrica]